MLVGFGLAIAVGLVIAAASGNATDDPALVPILVGIGLVGAVGLVDDLRDLRARTKLAGQLVAALVVVLLGLSFGRIGLPWGTVELGWVGPILTVAWLVAVMNALNLIDGLDGLAGGVALAAMVAFALVALMVGAPTPLLVTATGAGAVLGFLAYNRPPATIIMGDAGSMALGLLVGAAGVALVNAAPERVSPLVVLVALGLPLFDMLWAILRRFVAGRPIFVADSNHVHHQLLAAGLSRTVAMLVLVVVAALLGLGALLLVR
jgi:UDP-GlcNAc:undecaprenyl-phosphate GlcNAc-1-phosphate transferase